MSGRHDMKKDKVDQTHDERLQALLGMWQGVEPGDEFEADVWDRIHAVPAPEAGRWRLFVLPGVGDL